MDTTLDGRNSTNAFLDDILIISKGTLEQHENEKDKTLERLDNKNLAHQLTQMRIRSNRNHMARIQD